MKVLTQELSKDFDTLELYGLADLHWEDKGFDKKRAHQFREEVLAAPNRFVIINGDIINNATRTSVSDCYGARMTPDKAIDTVCEFIDPFKDRVLIVKDGNHEYRTYKQDGILLLKRVSKQLGIETETHHVYADEPYCLFLSFGKNQGRDYRKTVYTVYGTHGEGGGGKRVGGKANALEDMIRVMPADIFLHSHTHMPMAFRTKSFLPDYHNRIVTEKEHLFVNTNAFLNYGGYGEEHGFPPASTMYPKVILSGTERKAVAVV